MLLYNQENVLQLQKRSALTEIFLSFRGFQWPWKPTERSPNDVPEIRMSVNIHWVFLGLKREFPSCARLRKGADSVCVFAWLCIVFKLTSKVYSNFGDLYEVSFCDRQKFFIYYQAFWKVLLGVILFKAQIIKYRSLITWYYPTPMRGNGLVNDKGIPKR